MTKGFLKDLLRLNQTVFSFKELDRIWPNTDPTVIKSRINYYVKHNDLYHIRRGLYAKDKNYDHFEVANKIYIPSYISFETVLRTAGVTFQYYREIFVASYQSKSIEVDGQTYTFKTIKPSILLDATGIELKENYSIATPERAFLDAIYIYKDYHFDNLSPLNWDKVYGILPIYGDNKHMQKMVAMYHQSYQDSL
jgi:predicted transcriptional regulator of viral defense system